MRVAILVAVVAAHIVLLWLFPSLRRLVLPPGEDDMSVVPIVMPPLPPGREDALRPAVLSAPTPERRQGATAQRDESARQDESARRVSTAADGTANMGATANIAPSSQQPLFTPTPPAAPDWRAQAQVAAQSNAQHIVDAEDLAARQAAALTSGFEPLPGPRVPGPKFGWDETPMHRITPIGNGAFMIPLTDHCAIMILIVPLLGCSIGHTPPANGDLFKNMHEPLLMPSPHSPK